MAYSEKEFQGCLFNPLAKNILETYPRLKEIIEPEWEKQLYFTEILRYVLCVYDIKSPLQKNEKELVRRKEIAARLVELPVEKEAFIEEIYNGSNEICFGLITKFLIRFVKEKEYAALCAFEFKYYENISELLKPIVGETNAERLDAAKKKSVISDEIDKDIKRIDDYWEQIYGDKELVKQVKAKKLTPENIS